MRFEPQALVALVLGCAAAAVGAVPVSQYDNILKLAPAYQGQLARTYIANYTSLIATIERYLATVDGYPPGVREKIRASESHKGQVATLAFLRAELPRYQALAAAVIAPVVTTTVADRVERTESGFVLEGQVVSEATETAGQYVNTYRVTTLTWVNTIITRTIRTTTTTTKYGDGRVEATTSESVIQQASERVTRPEVQRTLVSQVALGVPPAERDWRTREFSRSWGLAAIGADAAYRQGWTGKGVTVAVLDSGVRAGHAELPNLLPGANFSSAAGGTNDVYGHGTHVAGIIAGARNDMGAHGVAFDATILAVKVLNDSGSGTRDGVRRGVAYATQQGAQVANLSLASYGAYNMTTQATASFDAGFGADYLNAVRSGMTLVMAAGNSGYACKPVANTSRVLGGIGDQVLTCSFPAALPSVKGYEELTRSKGGWITVGAVQQFDGRLVLASWSNRAGVMADYYLVAPGGSINSASTSDLTGHVVYQQSGTSMAAPHVAGAVALLVQKFPHLTGSQVAAILFQTATDLGDPGTDEVYGRGMLNVEKAMQPIGALRLPTGSSVSGASAGLSGTYVAASGAVGVAIARSATLGRAIVVDDYQRAFNVDLRRSVVVGGSSALNFDHYQYVDSGPVRLGLNPIQNMATNLPQVVFGLNLSRNAHVQFGQQDGIFGSASGGALEAGAGRTFYARYGHGLPGDGYRASAFVDYGVAPPQGGSGVITGTGTLHGLGFGASVAADVGERTSVRLLAKSPVAVVKGTARLSVPVGRNDDGAVVYEHEKLSMRAPVREYNLGLGITHRASKSLVLGFDVTQVFNVNGTALNAQRASLSARAAF